MAGEPDQCPICLEDIVMRGGRATSNCGGCGNPFHLSCLRLPSNCPLCRQPYDLLPEPEAVTTVNEPTEETEIDEYVVQIQSGPLRGQTLQIEVPHGSKIAVLGEALAERLDDRADTDSEYYNLELDPSRIVFYLGNGALTCDQVLPESDRRSVVARIDREGWQDHIQKLLNAGYEKLARFYQDQAEENVADTTIPWAVSYEFGAMLKLNVSLCNLGQTRGSSNTDIEEVEDEILGVLKEAKQQGRSMYEELRREFF